MKTHVEQIYIQSSITIDIPPANFQKFAKTPFTPHPHSSATSDQAGSLHGPRQGAGENHLSLGHGVTGQAFVCLQRLRNALIRQMGVARLR